MSSNYKHAVTNPLANKTQYVINCVYDFVSQRTQRARVQAMADDSVGVPATKYRADDEIWAVCEHELVFRHLHDSRFNRTAAGKYNNGRNHVFSALNGIDERNCRLSLAGVAVGSCSGLEDRMRAQGFAITREGVATIINTGRARITTGEHVYWKLPELDANDDGYPYVRGVPRGKRCAILVGTNAAEEEDRDRLVGYAIGSAEPGQPLDIVFTPGP